MNIPQEDLDTSFIPNDFQCPITGFIMCGREKTNTREKVMIVIKVSGARSLKVINEVLSLTDC